jgi:hypothetical protein
MFPVFLLFMTAPLQHFTLDGDFTNDFKLKNYAGRFFKNMAGTDEKNDL